MARLTLGGRTLTLGGRALLLVGQQIKLALHIPLPDEHPLYSSIGRVASEWAHLEHMLDLIIWDLSGIDSIKGACITGQMMGATPRYNAIWSLLKTMELNADFCNRIEKLKNKSYALADQRNRIAHDPWYLEQNTEQPAQFRAMPIKDPKYGMVEIDPAEISKTLTGIQKCRVEVANLRGEILTELETSHGKSQ